MGITERWVRSLLKRPGDRAVIHGLRGRPSNHRIGEAAREQVGGIQAEYRDFGPTLAAEYLAEGHGIVASKETVWQWMMGAKPWKAKPARVAEVDVWRARPRCGQLQLCHGGVACPPQTGTLYFAGNRNFLYTRA